MGEMLDFEEFKRRYQEVPVKEYPNRVVESVPEPVVSVRITTYQHADYIRDAIEGALMQETDFPIEILIGDDESTDGTREICKEYAEDYPEEIRLMLHRRENNVHLNGRPTHLFQYYYNTFCLRGEYIAGVSGDDYWTDPLKLQKQVEFLEANKEHVLAYHPFVVKHEGSSPSDTDELLQQAKRECKIKESLRPLTILYENVIEAYPEQVMEALCEDAFLYALLRRYGKFGLVRDINPAVYRKHESNLYSSTYQSPKTQLNRKMASFRTRIKILEALRKETIESRIKNQVRNEAIGWFYSVIRSPQLKEDPWKKKKSVWYCAKEIHRKGISIKAFLHIMRSEISRVIPTKTKSKLRKLWEKCKIYNYAWNI